MSSSDYDIGKLPMRDVINIGTMAYKRGNDGNCALTEDEKKIMQNIHNDNETMHAMH